MKKLSILFFSLLLSANVFSQGKDIADIAIGSADHSTLVAAVVAADLVGTLKSAGPFTVFAPTNSAFAAAPAGLTTMQLTSVLTYHVLAGEVLLRV